MYTNIIMKKPGIYIPKKKVYNDYYIKHFDRMGLKCEGLLNHLGRMKRHFAKKGETSLHMAIEATLNCLENNKVNIEEIDMIVYASDTPEYIVPSNAIMIVEEIKANNVQLAFDFNSNCTSMLSAIEMAKNTMTLNPKIKKAIVVGSFKSSMISRKDDTVAYANFGDAASAIILERIEEETKRGFLDLEMDLMSYYSQYTHFPKCGMDNLLNDKNLKRIEGRLEWIPFDSKFIPDKWTEMIKSILERNEMTAQEIDYYVFSALSNFDNMKTLDNLGINEDDKKYYYFGTEYGYTGCTCQALCLYRKWDDIAKPGNKIILCTVGAGGSFIAQLYKF